MHFCYGKIYNVKFIILIISVQLIGIMYIRIVVHKVPFIAFLMVA